MLKMTAIGNHIHIGRYLSYVYVGNTLLDTFVKVFHISQSITFFSAVAVIVNAGTFCLWAYLQDYSPIQTILILKLTAHDMTCICFPMIILSTAYFNSLAPFCRTPVL